MRSILIGLLISVTATVSTGCMATRKFTRNEVKTSSDKLNSRIDATEEQFKGEIKETRDSVDRVNTRVTGVDGRVTALDTKTTAGLNTLKGEVQGVDQKATQAQTTAQRAGQSTAMLDEKFQNRNQFTVANEKSIQFKFNSAQLDPGNNAVLDEIATAVIANPNAIVVLEGRTDSSGEPDYNVKLGERRVEAVRQYLAVEKEVPVYRIHNVSLGAARPIASNDSRDGREKNRAVSMTVLVPKAEGSVASK